MPEKFCLGSFAFKKIKGIKQLIGYTLDNDDLTWQ